MLQQPRWGHQPSSIGMFSHTGCSAAFCGVLSLTLMVPYFLFSSDLSLSRIHTYTHLSLPRFLLSLFYLQYFSFPACSLKVQVPWSLYLAAYLMSTSLTVLSVFSISVTPKSASEAFKLVHITTYLASEHGSRESKYKL